MCIVPKITFSFKVWITFKNLRVCKRFIAFDWKAKHFAFDGFLPLLLLHDFFGILGNSEHENILQNMNQLM